MAIARKCIDYAAITLANIMQILNGWLAIDKINIDAIIVD